jgi:hypothetical protein
VTGCDDDFRQADFSLPTLIGDPDFVWTLKQWDNTNWQRSSSVQIKPPQPNFPFLSASSTNLATIRIDSFRV